MQMQKDREYLKYLESQGEGKINWDVWDRMVEEFHKWMEEYFNKEPRNIPPDKRYRKIVYGYDNNGELVKEWESNTECSKEIQCSQSSINKYSKHQNVINGFLLSREKLTKDVASAMYRDCLHHGNVFQTGVTKTKHKKTVYRYNKDGKMVGVYESVYQFTKVTQSTCPNKLISRLSKGNIITKDSLLSYNFYDEQTAKEEYEEAMKKYRKR